MGNEEDKMMKSKLPSTEGLWNISVDMIRKTNEVSLYEAENRCGKLLLISNDVHYYKSEDIKNSNVKNILNEKIRIQVFNNRLMAFGLVTLNKTLYSKTRWFIIYYNKFDMSFLMKDLKQFEIENQGIYDSIPKNSDKYKNYIKNMKSYIISLEEDGLFPEEEVKEELLEFKEQWKGNQSFPLLEQDSEQPSKKYPQRVDCKKCDLYGECDHQGAYKKDGKWCYEIPLEQECDDCPIENHKRSDCMVCQKGIESTEASSTSHTVYCPICKVNYICQNKKENISEQDLRPIIRSAQEANKILRDVGLGGFLSKEYPSGNYTADYEIIRIFELMKRRVKEFTKKVGFENSNGIINEKAELKVLKITILYLLYPI